MKKRLTISLLVLSTILFISCKDENASSKVKKQNINSAKKRDIEISKGSAEIQFDQTEYDFGTVNEGVVVEAKFIVTNPGKTDLLISNVQPSCGCTIPIWPKDPIKPGESSEVLAKFDTSGKPNRQFKTLTLFTNTPRGREILKLRGSVTPKNPAIAK
ncbi:MAG: Uncharacterised protein [Flavobacterium sp. SCGC AAA160-P02]|nr:MAG: Uncharacterised protein [Flavobacterium sp. SCGC AAA160-P02]